MLNYSFIYITQEIAKVFKTSSPTFKSFGRKIQLFVDLVISRKSQAEIISEL